MASQAELEWWDKFADVMAEQWFLTPGLNGLLRKGYEEDYKSFLFKPGGRLLEIGCGTGWIGMNFAEMGMEVDGTDFSEEQLVIARRLADEKGLRTIQFFQRDLVTDPIQGRFEDYDAVLINAVLHHLSVTEYQTVLANCARVLRPGGKIYMYEPIDPKTSGGAGRLAVYPAEFLLRCFLFLFNRTGRITLQQQHFIEASRKGYTGTSPDEGPIDLQDIVAAIEDQDASVTEVKPWHSHNLAYAMGLMKLKPLYFMLFYPFVYVFAATDRLLFASVGWRSYGNGKSVMCAIKVER